MPSRSPFADPAPERRATTVPASAGPTNRRSSRSAPGR
jgi:hypothetical protein